MAQPVGSGHLGGSLNKLLTREGQRLPEQPSHLLDELTT